MELQMETKTSTAKPEPSIPDDEQSPLIKVESSEIPSQPHPLLATTVSGFSNEDIKPSPICHLIITIIFLILFLAILSLPFILLYILTRSPPDLTPTFHVGNVSVSSLNLSNCEVFSNWNLSFIVKNHEHGHPMFYDAIRVIVLYENEYFLSTGNVESFYLRGGQESMVKAWLGGSSVNVEKWVASAIETDRNTRREMDIVLVLDGLVTVNPGSEEHRKRQSVKAVCKDLKVELSDTAGSLSSRNSRSLCDLKFEDGP